MIDAILTNTMLPRVSQEILTRMMQGNPIKSIFGICGRLRLHL